MNKRSSLQKKSALNQESPEQTTEENDENTPEEDFHRKKLLIIWLIIACLIMIACSVYSVIHTYTMVGSAIAVIGGADGPTSIFVAGKIGNGTILLMIAALAVAVTMIYLFIRKRKK